MKLLIQLTLILSFISLSNLFPQTDSSYIKTDEIIKELLVEPPEEGDASDLYEELEFYLNNPVDVNTAAISDLQKLPGLKLADAQMIIEHRKRYGYFFSLQELYSISALNNETIENVIPFLTLSSQIDTTAFNEEEIYSESFFDKTKIKLRNRITKDIQERRGFGENKYAGNDLKSYNRLIARYSDKLQLGILAEKDAGETYFSDFTSYHLSLKNYFFVEHLVLGDYQIEFGQGLALWKPYGFSKSSDAIYPVKKNGRNITPYTSATENNFFRGGALGINLNDFLISFFYSNNKFDANIDTSTGEITSAPVTGFHRTDTELQRKRIADERVFGGSIQYQVPGLLNTGLLYYNSKFSNPFQQNSVFDLSGDEFNYYSFTYNLFIDKINFFGEAVYNGTSVASYNGAEFAITPDFGLITSIRSYPKNFTNMHGFGFGERSGATENEFGIYTGFRWRTPVGIINFYYDQFKFPYATFENPIPSEGKEFLLYWINKPIRKLETRLRFKLEDKEVTEEIEGRKQIAGRLKQNIRTELIYEPVKNLRLKGRFEYSYFSIEETGEKEDGYLFMHDLRFLPAKDVTLYLRLIFFKTDSFNSAIYEYENDVVGVLSNVAMFGEGLRWYAVVRYRLFKYFTLSLKYAETYKPDVRNISSGLNEIEGNLDNRLTLQLDMSF